MNYSDIISTILSISSFVCAVVSIVIVILTIKQNNKMLEESTRPVLSIYTAQCNNGSMNLEYVVVRNYGSSTARIESLDYSRSLISCYGIPDNKRDWLKGLEGNIIAPGQSKICYLDFDSITEPVVFNITYKSGAGKVYSEKYELDFSLGSMLEGVYTPKNEEDALKKLVVLVQEKAKREL